MENKFLFQQSKQTGFLSIFLSHLPRVPVIGTVVEPVGIQ